jgi:hypothetical protein
MSAEVDFLRVTELFHQGEALCPDKLKDIFVSNYKDSDGKDQLKDLWLFSDKYIIEVQNFIRQEKPMLDMTVISKNIQNVSIEASNFDLKKARAISKFHMTFYTYSNFSVDQIALSLNCEKLLRIFQKYVQGNLVEGQSSSLGQI